MIKSLCCVCVILIGAAALFSAIICLMKLISYAHVCHATRKFIDQVKKHDLDLVEELLGDELVADIVKTYPNNLTVGDMYLFMGYPTLCYELYFAKKAKCSKKRIIMWSIQCLCCGFLMLILRYTITKDFTYI